MIRLNIPRSAPLLLMLLSPLLTGWSRAAAEAPQAAPSVADVQQAVDRAVEFLVRRTRQDGRFVYLINFNPEVPVADIYNIVRHAGAISALCQYQERTPDAEVFRCLEASTAFLTRNIGLIKGHPNFQGVWSLASVHRTGEVSNVSLGGCGLGLAALCQWEQLSAGAVTAETRQRLARFVCFMQRDDGSFYGLYIPDKGFDPTWQSLYYPGEAALGLIMMYEVDGQRKWLDAAERALLYLADSRKGMDNVPHDHWALMATGRLLQTAEKDDVDVDRQRLVEHAATICRSILAAQVSPADDPLRAGAFDSRGRTTPCATRLEGLLSARRWLPDDLRKQVEASSERGIAFLLRAQQHGEKYAAGAVPMAISPLPMDHPGYNPRFNEKATEVRMDYQQHFISALLRYLDWRDEAS